MTICHYSAQFSDNGGIERVVKELVRIQGTHGVNSCVVVEAGGESGLGCGIREYRLSGMDNSARRAIWRRVIDECKPDIIVFHYVARQYVDRVMAEIVLLRELECCCLAVDHASFVTPMLLSGDEQVNEWFYRIAKQCDAVLTVSAIDATWWRALGLRSFHVQNPFVHPIKNAVVPRRGGEDDTTNLLWVGRQAEQKQPFVALATFARIVEECPSARLTMVGGSDAGWKDVRKGAERLGIADKVTCLAQRDDLSDLWDTADIHLLTSVTESFCLVLAEAKAKGIPSAMFEIPFLELVESGKGLVTTPQGDIEGLANQVIGLIKDSNRRLKLGEEALDSLRSFTDGAVWASWVRVFDALRTDEGGLEVDSAVRTIVMQQTFAWNRFCEKNLWAIQMSRDMAKLTGGLVTFRLMARILRFAVQGVQKLKGLVHG